MNATALRPVNLQIRINGDGNYKDPVSPFPYVYISDALSQNILYYSYETSRTAEELAKLCGVPAYYIEDSIKNLLYREAMSEVSKGKYRTEFIIYSDKVNEYSEKSKNIFLPVLDGFVSSMKALAKNAENIGHYTAGKTIDELIWLYGIMALEYLSDKHNPVKWIERPVRYDGCRWSYHAHLMTDNKFPVRGLGREQSANRGSHGTYQHISYHFGGFAYRRMMFDNEINVCEDVLCQREITDVDSAASLIENGFATRNAYPDLTVTTPAFTKPQHEQFTKCIEKDFAPSINEYKNAVEQYIAGYKKLFPSHIGDEVMRACNYMFLTLYATVICDMAKENGMLPAPSKNSVCDVLIQYK